VVYSVSESCYPETLVQWNFEEERCGEGFLKKVLGFGDIVTRTRPRRRPKKGGGRRLHPKTRGTLIPRGTTKDFSQLTAENRHLPQEKSKGSLLSQAEGGNESGLQAEGGGRLVRGAL